MTRNICEILLVFIAFSIFIMFLAILVVYIIQKGKRENNRKLKRIGCMGAILIGLVFIFYIGFEGLYIYNMKTYKTIKNVGEYKYEIILGSALNGNEPGIVLEKRLNLGIEYLNKYPNTKVIVSGGKGDDEVVSEAYAMKRYLLNHGIAEWRIIEENKSRNTVQNIAFSKKILKSRGALNEKVVIVTSDFHLYRARLIADELGVKTTGIASRSRLRIKLPYVILACPETLNSLFYGLKYII